ncbi:MAG: hypothetical protein LBS82_01530 [Spirochaetaceae bacterium]|jgi:hypothetical protein|nr:hypothetical protein [Spirochaetaceae bacterium]
MNRAVFPAALALHALLCSAAFARSFDELFPDAPAAQKEAAFSEEGYYNAVERQAGNEYAWTIHPADGANIDMTRTLPGGKPPGHFLETLIVLPLGAEGDPLLDCYNALGRTRNLEGRTYPSYSRGRPVPLFEAADRIDNLTNKRTLADPPPARAVPHSEEVFFRVKDNNFGRCYYASRLESGPASISYRLTNVEDITFYVFTVIQKENLHIHFYLEILDEGILVYALTGIELSSLAASRVDVPSAVKKRFDVIKGWLVDGINLPLGK